LPCCDSVVDHKDRIVVNVAPFVLW
jgi:hypothetical protein